MNQVWRDTFLSWATMDEYERRLDVTQGIIADRLAGSHKPYVAYSGGKDSLAMLHLVLQQKPEILVYHWDYGPAFMPREIERQVVRNAYLVGTENLKVDSSPEYKRKGRDARGVWYRVHFARVVPQMMRLGYDLSFVGLRKGESIKRKHRINAGRELSAIPECWPLAEWTWMDVWAYIVSNNLPYLAHYDHVADLVGYDRSRFATLFDPEFKHFGVESVDNVVYWRHRNEQ